VTGWYGEQWDFRNNEKTMKHSDHWIMTGWQEVQEEQWDFQNNEKRSLYCNSDYPTLSNFCITLFFIYIFV
jgi:hypothetical protein